MHSGSLEKMKDEAVLEPTFSGDMKGLLHYLA
jgi:hypothetical protein